MHVSVLSYCFMHVLVLPCCFMSLITGQECSAVTTAHKGLPCNQTALPPQNSLSGLPRQSSLSAMVVAVMSDQNHSLTSRQQHERPGALIKQQTVKWLTVRLIVVASGGPVSSSASLAALMFLSRVTTAGMVIEGRYPSTSPSNMTGRYFGAWGKCNKTWVGVMPRSHSTCVSKAHPCWGATVALQAGSMVNPSLRGTPGVCPRPPINETPHDVDLSVLFRQYECATHLLGCMSRVQCSGPDTGCRLLQ